MKKIPIAALYVTMLIQSCVAEVSISTEIATEVSSPTLISTPTQKPTATITHLPSFFPSATPTVTPTEKPFVPYPSSLILPDWMSNPQTTILANPITERRGNEITSASISFLNSLTGERYEIPFPSGAKAYFWYDNLHFGLLSNNLRMMYLLDMRTGQVAKQDVSIVSTRLLSRDDFFGPLKIKQDPLYPSSFLFDHALSFWGSPYSADTRYFAESDRSQNENPITVIDLETGQVIWQSNPSDGYWDVHFLWSPVKNSYIALVAGSISNTGFGFPINNTTLSLLDVETGEIISSYKIDAGRIQWSLDGKKLLYRNAISDYWNFGKGFTEAPCYFNFETRTESCFWRIPNRPLPNGYTLITTDNYQWSPDGKSIYFTYSYNSPDGMIGDICNYNLVDGSFTCPTANLFDLPGWNIDWQYGWRIATYNLSPDGKHIHFCLDSNHPLSDDQGGESKDGLINIDGTSLMTWVSQQIVDGQYKSSRCSFYSALWRPLP